MEQLLNDLNTALVQGLELKSKYFDGYAMVLDHVTLFTYDDAVYTDLNTKAKEVGVFIAEDERGSMYKLNQVLNINGVELNQFKVGKPNVHNHHSHKSGIFFTVENYADFKTTFNSINDSSVVKEELPNKFEILEANSEVVLYVTPQVKDEDKLEDMEDIKKEVESETSEDNVKAKLEEERMKRIQIMADFQNYQRRVENEKSTWGAVSSMGLIREMLEVYDDLHLALNDENLNLEHAKVSMKSAQDKLVIAASATGVEVIDVKVGDVFDKEKMEAVSAVAAGEDQKGKVIAVISSAYKYKDKDFILKPAKVVVGK